MFRGCTKTKKKKIKLLCSHALYRRGRGIESPALASHIHLNRLPNLFHDLLVPEARSVGAVAAAPSIDARRQHPMAPAADALGGLLPAPANKDAERVLEQLVGAAPLVVLELPRLPGGEDGHHAVPVLGLELLGALYEDEAQGAVGVDGPDDALDVEHAGCRGAGVGGHEFAVLEEGPRVGHAEERRGRRREEDDGVRSPSRAFLVEGEGGCRTGGGDRLGLLLDKRRRELANVREVLRTAVSSLSPMPGVGGRKNKKRMNAARSAGNAAGLVIHTVGLIPLSTVLRSPILRSPS